MRDWAIPAPLNRTPPRKVRMTPTALIAFLISLMGIGVPLYVFYALVIVPGHQKTMLETRGIDISESWWNEHPYPGSAAKLVP
jgi:hypothetical protein